jgi:hypothetical protein
MNTKATLEKMHQMKFYGMSRTYQAFLTQKDHEQLTHDNMVAHLVESEWLDREERKTNRYIRAARFRYPASVVLPGTWIRIKSCACQRVTISTIMKI